LGKLTIVFNFSPHSNKLSYESSCMAFHHKLHGPQFSNNCHVKSSFQRFVWNKHRCHSSICIIWTLMLCAFLNTNVICLFILFKHKCCMSIHVVYTWKLCIQLPCLNNTWIMNLWNNKFRMDLEWTHETYKFVMQCLKRQMCHS